MQPKKPKILNTNSFLVLHSTVLGLNRLFNLNLNADILSYVNDIVALVKNNYNELFKAANIYVNLIKKWCDCDNNNLQLNLSKSKHVIYNCINIYYLIYSLL